MAQRPNSKPKTRKEIYQALSQLKFKVYQAKMDEVTGLLVDVFAEHRIEDEFYGIMICGRSDYLEEHGTMTGQSELVMRLLKAGRMGLCEDYDFDVVPIPIWDWRDVAWKFRKPHMRSFIECHQAYMAHRIEELKS